MGKAQGRKDDLSQKNSVEIRFKLLFVYAFFKSDGADGVHEDLLSNVTREEALAHAKKMWVDADGYRISDRQLFDPYAYLFAKRRSIRLVRSRLEFPEEAPSKEEFEANIKHLDSINQTN